MTAPSPTKSTHKRVFTALSLGAAALTWIYLSFVFVLFIGVGLSNLHQQGFWLPVITGSSLLCLVFWLFFKLTRALFHNRASHLIK